MYKNEREHEIIKILSGENCATVKQLSEWLYTSESSIRRDLTSLENQVMVKRSYGGVELVKNGSDLSPFPSEPITILPQKNNGPKSRPPHDGDIVFLN